MKANPKKRPPRHASAAARKRVLAYLSKKARRGVVSGLSQPEIARVLRCSQMTVNTAISNLRDEGFLSVEYTREGARYILAAVAHSA
jgi:biotin operon repressor